MKRKTKNLSELFEKGKNFLSSIKPGDSVVLLYHSDVDGMTSAAITLIALERMSIKVSKFKSGNVEKARETLEELKGFDKAIILDIALDFLEGFEEMVECKTLFIDHHMIKRDLNSARIVHINPRFDMPETYQPVAYVVYKLLSAIVDLKDKEWIAVLGTIGDYGFEDCKDIVGKYVKATSSSDLPKTDFWKVALVLNGSAFEIGFNEVVKILMSAKDLEELKNNKLLNKAYESYEKEYNRCKEEFWRNAEEVEELNLIISVIKPMHIRMGSSISTELGIKHKDKMIILLEKIDDAYKVHARYQNSSLHLGKLLEAVCEGLNGGGGHERAAGAVVHEKNIEKFKKRLIKRLKTIKTGDKKENMA